MRLRAALALTLLATTLTAGTALADGPALDKKSDVPTISASTDPSTVTFTPGPAMRAAGVTDVIECHSFSYVPYLTLTVGKYQEQATGGYWCTKLPDFAAWRVEAEKLTGTVWRLDGTRTSPIESTWIKMTTPVNCPAVRHSYFRRTYSDATLTFTGYLPPTQTINSASSQVAISCT